MYAIALDIDATDMGKALTDAAGGFDEISGLLESEGFDDQGGSVYFGTAGAGVVEAVLAARRLGAELPWLRGCLREIRLLRVAEDTSMMAAFSSGADDA